MFRNLPEVTAVAWALVLLGTYIQVQQVPQNGKVESILYLQSECLIRQVGCIPT